MDSVALVARARQRGYAVLIMLVLVTMGILFTVVSQISAVGMKWAQRSGDNAALLQAKEALIGYAATYRDTHAGEVFGYLPCPDAEGDGAADAINNSINCGAAGQVVVGLLPYKTLGLGDLRDAEGGCLWYAVSPSYKAGMSKAEPMNWDTRGQIRILDNDGATVLADPLSGIEGGAAAVIFAPGPALSSNTAGRSSNASKVCGNSGKADWKAYLESVAADTSGNSGLDASGNSTANPLIVTKGTVGGSSNNDQIAWITPKDIFDKVKKRGDRGELNTLLTAVATALAAKINTDLVTATEPSTALPANSTAVSGPAPYAGHVGEVPSLTVSSDSTSLHDNWNGQQRYVVCSNLCGYCLDVGGQSCNGALLFGAEHTTGGPRPAHPTQLPDLLENDAATSGDDQGALRLASGATNLFTGRSSYSSGSADVGVCVAPSSAKPVTFNCNLSTFGLTSPSGLVTISGTSLTLGQAGITTGNGYSSGDLFGCAWSSDILTFGEGLRTYFNFVINNSGPGFVFAIIDATIFPVSTAPCGKSDQLLGYAGSNGRSSSIAPPKIGLEVHTSTSTAQGSPGYRHAALVYWGSGNSAADNDDNQHGATATIGYPSNPNVGSPGVSGNLGPTPTGNGVLVTGTTVHVRIDIVRAYDVTAHQGSYNIKAWLIKSPSAAQLVDLRNIAQDFILSSSGSLAATVSDAFTALNLPTGAASEAEALQKIRLGFTNAQGASDQVITIQNFAALSR